jgi:D-cysteine desulfhydrase
VRGELVSPDIAVSGPPPPANDELPLVRQFPALAAIPRARLGSFPTPVERVEGFRNVRDLWVKRDDLTANEMGGNKVRALEFLLGRVQPGDTVLTLGGIGSTHVLATVAHAARLGAHTIAVRWAHDLNPMARVVADEAVARGAECHDMPHVAIGYAFAWLLRLTRSVRFIGLGGSEPLGILGHVNAAFELAAQVNAGVLPAPKRVIVPLGSGGTMAGLALGFELAGLETRVIGARVGPTVGSNLVRVRRLARTTARFLARFTGRSVPDIARDRLEVVHGAYGGAYGRPSEAAQESAQSLYSLAGLRLDATYSAKAFLVAVDQAAHSPGATLFWLTFDGRWLPDEEGELSRTATRAIPIERRA